MKSPAAPPASSRGTGILWEFPWEELAVWKFSWVNSAVSKDLPWISHLENNLKDHKILPKVQKKKKRRILGKKYCDYILFLYLSLFLLQGMCSKRVRSGFYSCGVSNQIAWFRLAEQLCSNMISYLQTSFFF